MFESEFRLNAVAISEHSVPLPLLPATCAGKQFVKHRKSCAQVQRHAALFGGLQPLTNSGNLSHIYAIETHGIIIRKLINL